MSIDIVFHTVSVLVRLWVSHINTAELICYIIPLLCVENPVAEYKLSQQQATMTYNLKLTHVRCIDFHILKSVDPSTLFGPPLLTSL
jgi:hypothetical protein